MRRAVVALFMTILAAPAVAGPWQPKPAAYAYAPISRCDDKAAATMKPNEARYEICVDQMALFEAALEKARATGKLLIVDFGATWCPWCRSLQQQWHSPALLGHKSATLDFAGAFDVVEIGISTIHGGRRLDVPSGHAVLAAVLAHTPVKLRSVPFLVVIDPNDANHTVARNLDDFEQESAGRHDAMPIRRFLEEAHAHIRIGALPPNEPSWLVKKLKRAWSKVFG